MIDKEGLHKLLNLGTIESPATLIIYSKKSSSRLSYVCDFIFQQTLRINFVFTNSLAEFEASSLFKINYSENRIANSFQIVPYNLLFEKGVNEHKPKPEIKNGLIYFYNNTVSNDLHFDIFSSVFYFISRYEEWQHYEQDLHDRFELKESLLFKNNFHLKPVVEIWVEELKRELQKKNSDLVFPKREFKTIATIDVDNLFAYKNKGFARTLGAGLKDLVKFDVVNLIRRIKVVSGKAEDPFNIYNSFSKFCSEKNIPLIYFFLFKTGTEFDRTVNPESESYIAAFDVIKKHKSLIGLHPSYYSSKKIEQFTQERIDFSKKLNAEVKISRQHYLRFDIKTTPNILLNNHILADFSMGFATGTGFRAGTSLPFYYYDLSAEEKTELVLVPFCAMDGAYFIYNKISAEDARIALVKMKDELKKVNGLFITVFHERTFADYLYKGFGEMYKKLIST